MSKRHDKIGIKQGLRIEWLDYALNLKLSGMDSRDMREELTNYMRVRLDNGELGSRGESTTKIAVSMLMKIWGSATSEIEPLQKKSLILSKQNRAACHWGMICAAYPFLYKVAQKTGRLLNLQNQTNSRKIIQRVKEEYGERSSVIRSAQRVIQGFVGCGVLEVAPNNTLKLNGKISLSDDTATLLYESALYAEKEGRLPLGLLKNNPAFFPFQLPILTGDFISQQSKTIDVVRYGLDDELLTLIGYVK